MQYTENYKLNLIEPSDPFSPDALNENVKKLETELARVDAAAATIPKVTFGTYVGKHPTTQRIGLPFVPKMVSVFTEKGTMLIATAMTGRPAVNSSVNVLRIDGDGFWVDFTAGAPTNGTNTTYQYFAVG